MESIRIQNGEIERIEAYFVNTASVPLSGLNPRLTVRRQSDKFFWTGNQDFTSAFTQVAMSAVDATNQGGYYERTFDTTGLPDAVYSLIASGTAAANSPQTGELKVGFWVDNINQTISSVGSIGGGGVIHLEGLFTKKDKEELIALIRDEFKELLDKIELELGNLNSPNPVNISSDEELGRLNSISDSVSRYGLEMSNRLEAINTFVKQESTISQLRSQVSCLMCPSLSRN